MPTPLKGVYKIVCSSANHVLLTISLVCADLQSIRAGRLFSGYVLCWLYRFVLLHDGHSHSIVVAVTSSVSLHVSRKNCCWQSIPPESGVVSLADDVLCLQVRLAGLLMLTLFSSLSLERNVCDG